MAHYMLLLGWFRNDFTSHLTPVILEALHADATQAESDSGLASDGLVYKLDALSNVTRGGNFKKGERELLKRKAGEGRKKGKGSDEDEVMDGGSVEIKEVIDVVENVRENVTDEEEADEEDLSPFSSRFKKRLKERKEEKKESNRESLFPAPYKITPDNPNPPPIKGLYLLDIQTTSRSIILQFGRGEKENKEEIWLRVCDNSFSSI